jgi:hypothetical protein
VYWTILLGDFNAELGREDIFKPTIWNRSLHEISNGNVVTAVKSDTSKYLIVNSTTFAYRNIHKHPRTSSGGKTHNQVDHVLIGGVRI